MDVFISWTDADKEVKNALVDKVRDAGMTCWDSEEFCTSDYAQECTAAIRCSSVFIVIVSDASMEKGFVQNEITTARNLEGQGKINILVYKITDAPYSEAFDFLLNHISFVTGNLVSRKAGISGESGMDTIVKRAQALLTKRKNGEPEKPFRVHTPQINGLKITKTGYFVEGSRDDELERMEEAFQKSNVLILTELFGFGKRSTIKKFVEKHKDAYISAVMVPNEYGNLREFFLAGLEFTNLNDKLFADLEGDALLDAKFKQLEKLDEKTLLVIPDVQFQGLPDTALCERLAALKCRIVLITQETANAYADWFPVIQIGKMQEIHLFELFFHHYVRAFEEEREELTEPLRKFFADIGGHTKTVELTAAALGRDLGVAPEDVPGYLSMRGTEGMQLKDRIIRQIESIFDMDNLTPDEITALLVAACIAVPYISEKNYRSVLQSCGVEDWSVVAALDKRRWLDVDIQNRTVSMESLVARIVLSKFPDAYFVITKCMEYLMENVSKVFTFSITTSTHLQSIKKLEYFLSVTDLPECAQVASQLTRYMVGDQQFDYRNMEEAIGKFEEKYPAPKPDWQEDEQEDEQEYPALDWEELPDWLKKLGLDDEPDWEDDEPDWEDDEPDWEDDEEEYIPEEETEEVYDRNSYEQRTVESLRGLLIPSAKLAAKGAGTLLLDFSSEGQRVANHWNWQMAEAFDAEEIFGLSGEEMRSLLNALRQEARSREGLEEDSLEDLLIMECAALLDALYKRDQAAIMLSLQSLLEQIRKMPEIMAEEAYAEMVWPIFQMIGWMYLVSGAQASAIVLCEELLSYRAPAQRRTALLQVYIVALRQSKLYIPALYDAYEERLRGYDKTAKEVLDSRADMLREKRQLLLMYALDLAMGERLEEACKQFAAAWKLGTTTDVDDTACCAATIVDMMIRSGDFSGAVVFLAQYFRPDMILKFRQQGNEETQQTMDTFAMYQSAGSMAGDDFTDNADPQKYISYYQEYSRKNNPLLEKKYYAVADRALEFDFSSLTTEQIALHAQQLRKRAAKESVLRLAPEAFALASEAGMRVLGYRHHYVQYMGAAAMADGKIAEIFNGEGKTYAIVLTAFLRWLYKETVYVVDESSYLTARNHNWMQGVYDLLGVRSLCFTQEEKISDAREAVVYVDLKTLVFGFLRHERDTGAKRSDFPLGSAIVDEIDTTLVDEAEKTFILATHQTDRSILDWHEKAWAIAQEVLYDEQYYTCTRKRVTLNPKIYPLLEREFRVSYTDIANLDKIRQIEDLVETAILCGGHYEKEQDYFIHQGVPVRENREKGVFERFDATRSYFLCKENGLNLRWAASKLVNKTQTNNTICIRDFFKKFKFVCGTTATAASFRKEFREIYDLDYVAVPPHCPCIREDRESPVYLTMRAKDQAILEAVVEKHAAGQPVLLITQSVEESEKYDRLLRRRGIPHKLLNAKNANDSSDMVAWAGVPGSVLVANALAGRGVDIKLGGNPELKTRRELVEMGEDVAKLDSFLYSLPTPEQKESGLYKKYYSILEKNRALWAADRQAVVQAGGLCVIGTSFFPEPRTEQQTRGRSGRQGEVGESWVYCSLDDESLNNLISQSVLEGVRSFCDGVDEVDSPMLRRAIKNAQQRLHNARFASIRKINNREMYIDNARKDFIGLRFDLTEGIQEVDDLLERWASDKAVLQELQNLQKGETVNTISVLGRLWKKYPQLKNAKGGRAAKVLLDVVKTVVAQGALWPEYNQSSTLIGFLCIQLLEAWEGYIEIVDGSVGKVAMKHHALEHYLEAEKQRLLRMPVERVLEMSLFKPRK